MQIATSESILHLVLYYPFYTVIVFLIAY